MNKIKLLTAVAIFTLFAGAVLMHSCNKQEDLTQTPETTVPEKDYTIYNKISSFTKKMDYYKESPTYKSYESMPVDSALWLMEGAMNLTYGFPFEEYGEFTTGYAELTLNKNQDGEIDMDEVAVKYQQLIDEAREDYYNSGYEDKGLYILNLEKTYEDNGLVTFSVETVTGNRGVAPPWPFTLDDNWWYGDDDGGCAGNNASSSDAAQELAAAYPTYSLNENMAIAGPVYVSVVGGDEWLRRPNDNLDNLYDYYIFSVSENIEPFNMGQDLCLMAGEMATYYGFLDYVITELAREHENIPNCYDFIDFTVKYGYSVYVTDGGFFKYMHEFELWYGSPFEKPVNDPPVVL
jgi:hypothetical protein